MSFYNKVSKEVEEAARKVVNLHEDIKEKQRRLTELQSEVAALRNEYTQSKGELRNALRDYYGVRFPVKGLAIRSNLKTVVLVPSLVDLHTISIMTLAEAAM